MFEYEMTRCEFLRLYDVDAKDGWRASMLWQQQLRHEWAIYLLQSGRVDLQDVHQLLSVIWILGYWYPPEREIEKIRAHDALRQELGQLLIFAGYVRTDDVEESRRPQDREGYGRWVVGRLLSERGSLEFFDPIREVADWYTKFELLPINFPRRYIPVDNWEARASKKFRSAVALGNYDSVAEEFLMCTDIDGAAPAGDHAEIEKIFRDPVLAPHHQRLWRAMRAVICGNNSRQMQRHRGLVRKFLLRHGWRIRPQDLIVAA